jgi:hypothetical protein
MRNKIKFINSILYVFVFSWLTFGSEAFGQNEIGFNHDLYREAKVFISGQYHTILKSGEIVKVHFPEQALKEESKQELVKLIHSDRKKLISKNIKLPQAVGTLEFCQISINSKENLIALGSSLFIKSDTLWDEYSADSFWKLIFSWEGKGVLKFEREATPPLPPIQ